jgi:D-alanyl-D-alanine carboxypeptidase/D-alanyl-D-alanine-endopeptidase (penicillin-binding protein 4)
MSCLKMVVGWMVLVGLLVGGSAAESVPPQDLARQWQSALLRMPGGQGMRSSLCLCDEAGQTVVEWDADGLMLPASTLKVATAVGILEQGGGSQSLTTRLQLSGQRLRWMGDYDPELTSGDLEDLTLQLLPKLSGKVQLEVAAPDSEPYPPGWSWDDLSSSFAPPIGRLVFDHGLIPMKLLAGQQLRVAGPPWAPPGGLNFLPREGEFEMLVLPGWENWVMAGQIPAGVEEAVTVPMLRPELAAARLLSEVLRRQGVEVEVVEPAALGGPTLEVSHRSRPVEQILAQGLADSDNLVLECLYRRFGKALPRCWVGSTQRVVDGCGLSRYNLVSTRQLLQLLQVHPQVVRLLPRAGQEGTLRKRFQGTALQSEMRAKTGTMSGVSGLVGEFPGATGKRYRFALLLQGYVGSSLAFKKAEEDLLVRLAQIL